MSHVRALVEGARIPTKLLPCVDVFFAVLPHSWGMRLSQPAFSLSLLHGFWNWKCALLSATARSIVYLLAMAHHGQQGRLAVVLVEAAYVTLTAGLWAGLQQRALELQRRALGNLIVVVVVPSFAQGLDWATHALAGAAAPPRAMLAVCAFTLLSAFFHLYVMRQGVFLSGKGRSLTEDFRRMPRLVAAFVLRPLAAVAAPMQRLVRMLEPDAML